MGAYEDPHLAGIEELPVPRLWDEQVVGKCSSKLRAQPAFGCPAEEPDLPLVNDALGNKAERCFLQDILCGKASHLQAAGDPRAVDLVAALRELFDLPEVGADDVADLPPDAGEEPPRRGSEPRVEARHEESATRPGGSAG